MTERKAGRRLPWLEFALAIAVFAFARWANGRWLNFGADVAFSPVTGLALAYLLLRGRSHWPLPAIGMMLGHFAVGGPPIANVVGTVVMTGELLLVHALLTGPLQFDLRMQRARDAAALAAIAMLAVLAGGLLLAPVVRATARPGGVPPPQIMGHLWLSQVIGVLLLTPATLAWGLPREKSPEPRRQAEVLVCSALALAGAVAILTRGEDPTIGVRLFALGVMPLMAWVTLRGEKRIALTLPVAVLTVLVYGTSRGMGPLAGQPRELALQTLQSTLGLIALFSTLMCAIESGRRVALDALHERETRLRRVLESSNDGFWDYDVRADRLDWSDSIGRWLGYAPDELPTRRADFMTLVHPDDLGEAHRAVDDHLAGRTPRYAIEYRVRHREGHWVWVLGRGHAHTRGLNGEPLQLSGTFTDITERKHAEQERRVLEARMTEAQKLESLGLLAGGVAHDFNNILTGILGHADLARGKLPQDSPARGHLDHVVSGARSAADLTRQMLAYAGRRSLQPRRVDVGAIVREMGQLLEVSIPRTAALRVDIEEGLPAVQGDEAQLRQVVMNLILNAAEAVGAQPGPIDVRIFARELRRDQLASRWGADEPGEGVYVVIEVADRGAGMSDETLAKIFDPFFSTKFTGRGLGLAAVLGIVRGHSGVIQVETAQRRGTTFRVLLPASSGGHAAPSAPAPATTPWRAGGTAMVVDDDTSVRTLAAEMMRRMGFERVLTAACGREGIELFRVHAAEIGVVLLDVTMPDTDGESVRKAMQAIRADAPIVMSSGYSETRPSECDVTFIAKPYRAQELADALRRAMEPAAR